MSQRYNNCRAYTYGDLASAKELALAMIPHEPSNP